MFSVKLNVHEDEELRAYIKDLIRGQVRAGIRGTITEEIKQLTRKKYPNDEFEEFIKKMVQDALTKDTKLRRLIEQEAEKYVKREVGRVFAAYREDYDSIESTQPRKIDI